MEKVKNNKSNIWVKCASIVAGTAIVIAASAIFLPSHSINVGLL